MFVLCFLFSILTTDFSVGMDQLGLYQNLQIQKVKTGYVFTSTLDVGIVTTDPSGKITGSHRKKGEGPDELDAPFYMGYYEGHHLVLTQFHRILAFNDRLEPMPGKFQKLSPELSVLGYFGGVVTSDGVFWYSQGVPHNPYLAKKVAYEGDQWVLKKTLFPQVKLPVASDKHQMIRDSSKCLMVRPSNGVPFRSRIAQFLDETNYQVDVFSSFMSDQKPVISLIGDVTDFSGRLFHLLDTKSAVTHCAALEGGYVVFLDARVKPSDKDVTQFADFFSQDGKRIRRVEYDLNLYPCLNSKELFYVASSNGKEVLRRVNSVEEAMSLLQNQE